jgi:heterodisulfide reductase subunit C
MTTIDSKKLDPNFKYEIAKEDGGEGILKCFACGACTARCPEMDVHPEWNARTTIRKAVLGLKDEVYASEFIWICSAHFRCLEKCPQKVNVKEIMNAVRNQKLTDHHIDDTTNRPHTDTMDPTFKYTIAKTDQGKNLYECFSCGTCTAGCPERELDPLYSPRRVIKNVVLGLKDPVYDNKFIDICSSHHRCLTQCPQGVEIPKLMKAIKTLAEREGHTRPTTPHKEETHANK